MSSGLVFLGCDAVWLSLAAGRLYRPRLGALLRDDFAVGPAALFYVIYIVGILVFAVFPALETGRWTTALGRGALLGFVAYATYDLTNQATLRGWSAVVSAVDMGWGAILTGAASLAGFAAIRWLLIRA
ncbi:DUF2177 family protein [Alsobacter sp. SYSU M60028]|uniref:DUF2177 family protein n=1 Tax=Alsobacter ponti TaxID=2962936 RepID=A0ABT1LD48_9HYPH|nr:DUF2177 family protein [Alsobacter ponti]